MCKKIILGSFASFVLSGTIIYLFCKKDLKKICKYICDDKEFSIHLEGGA
jgi:hypothetical protein